MMVYVKHTDNDFGFRLPMISWMISIDNVLFLHYKLLASQYGLFRISVPPGNCGY
jgi:hypothetical protein